MAFLAIRGGIVPTSASVRPGSICFELSNRCFNPVHRLTHIRDLSPVFALLLRLLQDIVSISE